MCLNLTYGQCNHWLRKMKQFSEDSDIERSHSNADDLLVKIVRSIGLNEIADIYDDMTKWYS